MSKVHELAGGLLVSISTIAREFGMARETVAKRLDQAGVKPAGQARGFPAYRIAEAAKAILATAASAGESDPESLPPFERKAWYSGESERLKVAVEKRQLVTLDEHEAQLAAVIKRTVQLLATLPDRLERQCGLSADVIEQITIECEAARADYHEDLTSDE